jgi:hypothetical protein
VVLVGGSFTMTGSDFTAGSRVNFFVATGTGPINAGPLIPTTHSRTTLSVAVPSTTALGQGFVDMQVVNIDQGFAASNFKGTLLQGLASAGIPSLASINGKGLAATSRNPSFGTDNVETVLEQGTNVTLGGMGFDTRDGVAVDLFCACPKNSGSKIPTIFLNPGNIGLGATSLTVALPPASILPPGPGSIVISNRGADGLYSRKSNAVSVPIGAPISVTSVSQRGSTITVSGTGFSTLTVINFFAATSGGVANLGGLNARGTARIPLKLSSANQFTYSTPTGALPSPAFVQAFNPPFVPFTSSGTGSGGGFTLK